MVDHSDGRDASSLELSIVVPVFNSVNSLPDILSRFRAAIADTNIASWEILFIDDGSPNPESWRTISELAERNPEVRAFRLSRNFGKAGAVLCGFSNVRGRYVLTIDDDLEQQPEDLFKLWKCRDHDVVVGTFKERTHGSFVRLSSKLKAWFDKILIGKPKEIRLTPYKLYKRYVVDTMVSMTTPFPFISGLMMYVTRDIVNVEVTHSSRQEGSAGFTFRKRFRQFTSLLINNSSFLLQVIASLGILLSAISMVYGGVIIYRALQYGVTISGWPSLMVALLFIGGAMLFSLGVIGEYLIRIIKGVEKRPSFIIRDTTDNEKN